MLCKLWWFRLDKSSRQCSQVEFQECAPISELLILCKDYDFRWTFRSPNHGANFFDFSCEGGCIEPGMVRQATKKSFLVPLRPYHPPLPLMYKKSGPFIYTKLLHKLGQDFLDRKYVTVNLLLELLCLY